MEKIVFIDSDKTAEVNAILKNGWKVKFIIPCAEHVSSSQISNHGVYGAYAVLESTT